MKLKLNIQRFSSTNATTHYELSQYIGTDKPTYLVDYNQDMSKIDTAIYSADSTATQASNNIGTISNLNTTTKTDLVSAINEVNTQVGTNTSNISTNTSNISTLGNNQGVMANLTTTEKSTLVGAINEVKSVNDTQNTKITSLENMLDFTDIDDCTLTIAGTHANISYSNISCAKNSDGSIFKIYGSFTAHMDAWTDFTVTISNTGLPRIDTEYTISGASMAYLNSGAMRIISVTYKTNVDLKIETGSVEGTTWYFYLPPCIYINSNFGDTPNNQ